MNRGVIMKGERNVINLSRIGNQRYGFLSFFESEKDVPFEIKRVYYIYDVPAGTKRGMHAHKTLKQFLWCPYGAIKIVLDNGKEKKEYILDSPQKGLIVGEGIWHNMYWLKDNSVLCVAASDYYDENDYIRDYDEFLRLVQEAYWKDENKL